MQNRDIIIPPKLSDGDWTYDEIISLIAADTVYSDKSAILCNNSDCSSKNITCDDCLFNGIIIVEEYVSQLVIYEKLDRLGL